MTDTAAHASRMEVRKHRISFIIATIAAIFMTVTGALGTDEAPWFIRLVFWLIAMESGALIGMGVTMGIASWGMLRARPIVEGMVVGACIALPLTLIVIAARSIMFGLPIPSPAGMAIMFGYVLFVSLIITAVDYAMIGRTPQSAAHALPPQPESAASMTAPPPTDTRFRDRLPLHLRAQPILALESEDHYLRVHCDGGDTLILMRLADAIAELTHENGAQTHRSWWVNKAAITGVTKGDGRAAITLSNGVEVPVSRAQYQSLRKSGWLDL
jgi:hypothetical protein